MGGVTFGFQTNTFRCGTAVAHTRLSSLGLWLAIAVLTCDRSPYDRCSVRGHDRDLAMVTIGEECHTLASWRVRLEG